MVKLDFMTQILVQQNDNLRKNGADTYSGGDADTKIFHGYADGTSRALIRQNTLADTINLYHSIANRGRNSE